MFVFFTYIKKTNQKKVQPFTWSRDAGRPCAPRNDREFKNSHPFRGFIPPWGVLRQFKFLFGHFCGARLREMAFTYKTEISNSFWNFLKNCWQLVPAGCYHIVMGRFTVSVLRARPGYCSPEPGGAGETKPNGLEPQSSKHS